MDIDIDSFTGNSSFNALEEMQRFAALLIESDLSWLSRFEVGDRVGEFNISGISWCNIDSGVIQDDISSNKSVKNIANYLQILVNFLFLCFFINMCKCFGNYI